MKNIKTLKRFGYNHFLKYFLTYQPNTTLLFTKQITLCNMGKMKTMIDGLIKAKSNGNKFQEYNVRMKMMLKGIPVNNISEETPDDPEILTLIYQVAEDFNVMLDRAS